MKLTLTFTGDGVRRKNRMEEEFAEDNHLVH